MFPDLAALLEKFRVQMSRVDELSQVLLKGHLILEEALTQILEQYVFHRTYLHIARLSFYDKMLLCRSLCLRKDAFVEWELLAALNTLRNDLAHRLDSADRQRKLDRVREVHLRATAEADWVEKIRDAHPADAMVLACAHCAGFLASFEADSRAFRRIVHSIDRNLNPESPEFEL